MAAGEDAPDPQEGRGNVVPVEKEFLDRLHALWHEVKEGRHPSSGGVSTSLERFGTMLAEAVGREKPWSKASLSRFFRGERTTDDLLHALTSFFGVPNPLIAARNEREITWFATGRALLKESPEDFEKVLRNAQARLARHREIRELDRELGITPDET